ncbi:HpcH/HpaI aldolase/citrate lyase family protein [Cobetia sp. 5-25-4-2]|uniref:HpcH/HpaI aldolase family protein n=1 Tax=Cobetia sp. 5-25-4-2 TaxID=2737459 RepID=UPI001596FCB1|nr:aldolase/citrate lyase family protein [Cobetia sp. 5-25-4-2]
MRLNRLKQRVAQKEGVVNGWLSMPCAFSAEIMAHQGWDSLTIDLQHGVIDYSDLLPMLTAISTTDTVPLVRVPSLEPGLIMKVLDAGAYGVIAPLINTADDARALVAACRYPPLGMRSFGPHRAMLYGGADYAKHANDEMLVLGMIETREGVANLEEILAVEGLDGLYIGPADLALSHGHAPGFDHGDGPMDTLIGQLIERARLHDKIVGIHNGGAAHAKRMLARGCDLVTVGSDTRLLMAGARELLSAMERETDHREGY